MEKVIILFNGIRLPFALVERAFSWAHQSNGEVLAVFLRAKSDPAEGYVFPSDLDAAENLTSTEEAGASHEQLIDSNIRIVTNQAASQKIQLLTHVLVDPTEEELQQLLTGATRIFVHTNIAKPATLTTDKIDLDNWLKNSPVPVEMVQD